MKLVIEMNSADLASAKAEHMNQIIAAMQAVALDREAEAPAETVPAVNETAEHAVKPSQPAAKALPKEDTTKTMDEAKKAAQKPKEEKPAKAAAKKAQVKKEEPKVEEPADEAPEPVKAEEPVEEEKQESQEQEAPKEEEPAVDRETVLNTFKALAKAGKSADCKKILQGHGLKKLSEIPEDLLGEILKEAKALG